MSAYINEVAYDEALKLIRDNADTVTYCNVLPSTYSEATTLASGAGAKLANREVGVANITLQAGDGTGNARKITLDQGGYVADESGSVSHVVIVDDSNSRILAAVEQGDGAGGDLSVTADLAYNQDATDIEIPEATTV